MRSEQDNQRQPGKRRSQQRQDDGPYRNGTVVVVEKPSQRLFVSQPVFVIVDANGARWGRIQSMKIDDTDVQAVKPDMAAANGIGIALDFKCPAGATLITLSVDDDVVWTLETGAAESGHSDFESGTATHELSAEL